MTEACIWQNILLGGSHDVDILLEGGLLNAMLDCKEGKGGGGGGGVQNCGKKWLRNM